MPNKERTTFTLSAQVKNELEKLIPKSSRSQFIEHAITEALKQRQQQELFALIDAIEPVQIGQDSSELISQLRTAGINRIVAP